MSYYNAPQNHSVFNAPSFYIGSGETQVNRLKTSTRFYSTEPQTVVEEKGSEVTQQDEQKKSCSPKVAALVEQITLLNLTEAAELVQELKSQLNLPETSYQPSFQPFPMGAVGKVAEDNADAEEEPEEIKTVVNIQLDSFDEKTKIKVIKEVKGLTNAGLKEAKEMVEGAPRVILEEIKREEAEEIAKTLTELGAKVSLI